MTPVRSSRRRLKTACGRYETIWKKIQGEVAEKTLVERYLEARM